MNGEMEVFAQRLKAEVKRVGRKAFAEKADIPLSTLNSYLAGVEPKITMVVRIAKALGLSVAELLDQSEQSTVPESVGSRTSDDSIEVRLLDVVASAGPGMESPHAADPPLKSLPFSRRLLAELGVSWANARFLPSRGDSMEPNIKENAIVLVDTTYDRAKDDGVYVLVVGNDVRIKRVGHSWDGKIELISDNPLYPNDKLSVSEAETLRIAGKVVWAGGKI